MLCNINLFLTILILSTGLDITLLDNFKKWLHCHRSVAPYGVLNQSSNELQAWSGGKAKVGNISKSSSRPDHTVHLLHLCIFSFNNFSVSQLMSAATENT